MTPKDSGQLWPRGPTNKDSGSATVWSSWPEDNLLPGQVSNILSPARVCESETQPFLLAAFPFSSVRAEGR